jgi:hypothetical protein
LHALDVPSQTRSARRPRYRPASPAGRSRFSPPGAEADIVVLDDALEIRTVFVGGEALVAA